MKKKDKDKNETIDLGVKNVIAIKSVDDLLMFMEAKEMVFEILNKLTDNDEIRNTYSKIVEILSSKQRMLLELLSVASGLYMSAYGVTFTVCMKKHNDKNRCIKLLYYMNSVFMDIMLNFIYEMPSDVVEMINGGLGEINKEELFKKLDRIGEYIQ